MATTPTTSTNPLQDLLDQVRRRLDRKGLEGHVHRIEFGRKGSVQLEVAVGEKRLWFAARDGELKKLKIARDRKVPLAARLKDKSFAARVRPLSYRPGRRLTLLDESGHKPKIVKGFRRGRLEGMLRKYELAGEALADHAVFAPEILEYDEDDQSLIMLRKQGERLRLSADTADLFQLVGEGLREFQDFENAADLGSPFTSEDELKVLDKRRTRLESAGLGLPARWPALRDRIGEAEADLPPPRWGLAHRDLHDKQVLQYHHRLSLLDFDLMSRADTTLDPANFLAHLVLRNLQSVQGATQRSIDDCGKSLLQGLARNEESGFWERLRFYQATTFARLALIYLARPPWSHLAGDLVTMGHRCLDDFDRIRRIR